MWLASVRTGQVDMRWKGPDFRNCVIRPWYESLLSNSAIIGPASMRVRFTELSLETFLVTARPNGVSRLRHAKQIFAEIV
jgi:hypothetical protein